MSQIMKRIDIVNPRRHIKRGGVHYRYSGNSYNARPLAEIQAHYMCKGAGLVYYIVHESFTKPQTRLEKFVLGAVPVVHTYHVYLANEPPTHRGGK